MRLDSDRRFGVELETCTPASRYNLGGLQGALTPLGFANKGDGSIRGQEFYTRDVMRGQTSLDKVAQATELINDKCEINETCGYHLHCDLSVCNTPQIKSVALAYHYTYPLWANFVEAGRATTSWCPRHHWNRDDIRGIRDKMGVNDFSCRQDRYQWINFAAYNSFGSVEMRLHEATLDPLTVTNWVKANVRFIDGVQNLSEAKIIRIFANKSINDLYREFRMIWMDHEVSSFYAARLRQNNIDASRVITNPFLVENVRR